MIIATLLPALALVPATIDRDVSLLDGLRAMVPQVEALYSGTVQEWRYTRDDPQAATARMLDDSSWQAVSPGFVWEGENTKVWFRATATIPASVAGQSTEGSSGS